MKREILDHKMGKYITGCCPGHDEFPAETYNSRRSKRARTRDKKTEHQHVRRYGKSHIREELADLHREKIERDEQARQEWEELMESMAEDGEAYMAFCARLLAEEEQMREDLAMRDWEEDYYRSQRLEREEDYGSDDWYSPYLSSSDYEW